MGWFSFGGRNSADESPSPASASADGTSKPGADSLTWQGGRPPKAVHVVAADVPGKVQTAAGESIPSTTPLLQEEEEGGEGWGQGSAASAGGVGLVDRLKTAARDCVDTAKRAPETFEEALAVIKGEGPVKPDYGRAVSTVSMAFAGGCAHGWWQSAAVAAKFPPHQRSAVRVRAGFGKGVRFAAFAIVFESSSAIMEALRRKKDFVGGTVGGALAGMAYGVSDGVVAARRGLFYGIWLGGVFGLFRNHVASLREQVQRAEEEERLMQEERDAIGRAALARSIAGLDAQLKTWPAAREDETDPKPTSSPRT